jgi:MFS family permease
MATLSTAGEDKSTSSTFLASLANRDFRFLMASLGVSQVGDWLYSVALVVYVFEETGSAGWVAAATMVRFIPYIALGPIAGVVASRYERRSVMIVADLVRAMLMAALALVAATSGQVELAIAITFLATVFSTPYNPAVASLVPSLVRPGDLAAANALRETVSATALLVGPALGGILLFLGSPALAFAINAGTFLLSALFIGLLSRQPRLPAEEETPFLQQLSQGFSAIRTSGAIAVLVALDVVATFVYGQEIVLLVLVAEEKLDIGGEGLGFLNAAIGAGGLVGAAVSSRLASDPRLGRTLVLANLAYGLPFIGLALFEIPAVAYGLMAVDGAGNVVFQVVLITMLQRLLHADLLARVFGILDSLDLAGLLAGSLLAPIMVELFGLEAALVVAGLTLPIATAAMLPAIARLDTRSAEEARALAERVDLLESLNIFSDASRTAIEALAQSLVEMKISGGELIISQGEAAADFYIVRSGSFDVLVSTADDRQEKVNELTAGDYFGEIGLLERVPRTASVVATTDSSFYRLAGDDFLNALSQLAVVPIGLRQTISRRLARTPGTAPAAQDTR